MATTKELMEIQVALRNKQKLTDEQVCKVAELRRDHNKDNSWVPVQKLALRQGEELWDFVDKMMTAVFTNRVLLVDGSLDPWLRGIYDEYVIVEDGNTGRLFKADFTRDADGNISFAEPVEVVQAFIAVDGSSDQVERAITKSKKEIQHCNLAQLKKSKWSFLGNTFARRGR